jgi:hypothetical protein
LSKKIVVVGKGKWGKKVISALKKVSQIIQIVDSKTPKKNIFTNNVDWAFILTPYDKHYSLTKFFLKKKINVFCEKPLDKNPEKFEKLLKLSKAQNVKLYIDDIELYKKKKLIIKKVNFIKRYKHDIEKKEPIIYRLAYHDIYLLYDSLKKLNNLKIKIINNNSKQCYFKIHDKIKEFHFDYKINEIKKIHKINNINFLKFRKNPLKLMIKNVLFPLQKNVYQKNNFRAQLTTKILNKIDKVKR